MKKQLLLLSFIFSAAFVYGQHTAFQEPAIWLRSDSSGQSNSHWTDYSGHGRHAYIFNGGILPDTALFNYNPCFLFDSTDERLIVDYQPKKSSKLMVFVVYRPSDPINELGVWNLVLDSVTSAGLTTQRLKNVYKIFPYSDSSQQAPKINLNNQNWANKHVDTSQCKLFVAGTDSLNFYGKFAEFMLYDSVLHIRDIYKIHTYLAVKYGVSITDMNYVLSSDSTLWDYQDNIEYKNDIAAIGKDSLIDVFQKQSSGNGGESPLKIAAGTLCESNVLNPYQIAEGDFLIWGHNGQALEPAETDTLLPGQIPALSQCIWLMRTSGNTYQSIPTQLVMNISELSGITEVNLVVNRQADAIFAADSSIIYPADSVDSLGNFYFYAVFWDTDLSGSDVFAFQFPELAPDEKTGSENMDPSQQSNAAEQNLLTLPENQQGENSVLLSCTMFPNPAPHSYTITLKMKTLQPVTVEIWDENGKQVDHFVREGNTLYTLDGLIQETGCYFVTVSSEGETQTYKLVVN